MKTIEDKRMFKFEFFSQLPFLGIYERKKIRIFSFVVHGHSSGSAFGLHLVRGPKALQIDFLKETQPWEKAIFHGPTS
jgi:hypothetical protein